MNKTTILAAINAADSFDELAHAMADAGDNADLLTAGVARDRALLERDLVESAPVAAPVLMTTVVAAVVAPVAPPVAALPRNDSENTTLYIRLQTDVNACDTAEALHALVPSLTAATVASKFFVARKNIMELVKARFKDLGVKVLIPEMNKLFRSPKVRREVENEFTEFGASDRLQAKEGHRIRYVSDTRKWAMFDGCVWAMHSDVDGITNLADRVIRDMKLEAMANPDLEIADELSRIALGMQRTGGKLAVANGLKGREGLTITSFEMDTEPTLLQAKNGIIDLTTGKLLPHDRDAMLTMCTACDYNPAATAPVFAQTLKDVLGDDERVAFLQRYMGYAVLGNPKEKTMLVPLGKGNTGKSTIFNVLQAVLGTHATTMASNVIATPLGAIVSSNPGGPTEHLTRLRGKRAVFVGEVKRSSRYIDDTIKTLVSGGDMVTARTLNAESITFAPTGAFISPCNVLGQVLDDDDALWDRLAILRFTNQFVAGKKDVGRTAKLEAEAEGILAWLVQGALEYQLMGMAIPESMHRAKRMLREEASPMNLFIEDCCDLASYFVSSADELFSAWLHHSFQQGEKHTAQTKIGFGRFISANAGIEVDRVKVRGKLVRVYRGIRLRDSLFELPPAPVMSTQLAIE